MMDRISYVFLRLLIALMSLLSFRAMYVLSDFFYFVVYRLVGYRKKVVFSNLRNSFPEKTEKEIREIARKFYHHLCDIGLESMKGFSIGYNEVARRHKIVNIELARKYLDANRSIISVPAHYNNWEWGTLSPGGQLHCDIVAFYKPLSNKLVDAYMKTSRARFKTWLASIRETSLAFSQAVNKASVFVMAADQSPSNLRSALWVNFLGQDTACLHGPEFYARKYDVPVVYVDIRKVQRGFYELHLDLITDQPRHEDEGFITAQYMHKLEQSILREPAYWLWSHRRWKHTRPASGSI